MKMLFAALLVLLSGCALKQEFNAGLPNPQALVCKTAANFAGKNATGTTLAIATLTEDVRFAIFINKLDQDVVVKIGSVDWTKVYRSGDVLTVDFGADGTALPSGSVITAYHGGGVTDPASGEFCLMGQF